MGELLIPTSGWFFTGFGLTVLAIILQSKIVFFAAAIALLLGLISIFL